MKPFQKLRDLEAKATPGPWWCRLEFDGTRTSCVAQLADDESSEIEISHSINFKKGEYARDDALIAEMRNQLPKLLEALDVAIEAMGSVRNQTILWEKGDAAARLIRTTHTIAANALTRVRELGATK